MSSTTLPNILLHLSPLRISSLWNIHCFMITCFLRTQTLWFKINEFSVVQVYKKSFVHLYATVPISSILEQSQTEQGANRNLEKHSLSLFEFCMKNSKINYVINYCTSWVVQFFPKKVFLILIFSQRSPIFRKTRSVSSTAVTAVKNNSRILLFSWRYRFGN